MCSLIAAALIALSLFLAFYSGCGGDPKTGVYGNPLVALERERYAATSMLVGLVMAAIAYHSLSKLPILRRSISAIALPIVALVPLWLLAVYLQVVGISVCFGP